MNKYNKTKSVEELIKGKKVVLIGPSPHLLDKGHGETFDEYDLIARSGDVFPKFYGDDYGHRTDIFFYTNPSLAVEEFDLKIMSNSYVAQNIKLMICPTIKADHQWKDSVEENWKKINKFNIPSYFIGKENYEYLSKKLMVEPSCGIASIMILLEYEPKEILVTGYSFYSQFDIDNPNQVDCYYPGYVLPQFQVKTFCPPKSHNQMHFLEYFKREILTNYSDIVKIDSYLNKIYNLNYKNIFEL